MGKINTAPLPGNKASCHKLVQGVSPADNNWVVMLHVGDCRAVAVRNSQQRRHPSVCLASRVRVGVIVAFEELESPPSYAQRTEH